MAEGEGKGADCFPQTTKSETHGADYAPWTLYHAVLSPAKNGNGSCPSASPAEDVKLLDNLSSSIGHQARHRGYTAVRHKCHLHLHETCGLEGKRNIKGISQQLNIIVIRCHEGDSDKKSSMARNRWQWHLSRIDQTPGTKKKSEAAAVCRGAGIFSKDLRDLEEMSPGDQALYSSEVVPLFYFYFFVQKPLTSLPTWGTDKELPVLCLS
ncbi:uncharacterized protein LOC105726151 isoform X2 [Aotus nancymaae]|uniref:uncharacterized protein LOC105726151 isoform X2 n=1 Tax=Aotus nancymaae TaxID=37293 RepID=UPI0030FE8DB5